MIKNYLKIAVRNLLRNKVYSFINIGGLALGIAAFLFILEYVSLEQSVNQFHTQLPQMYRVLSQNTQGQSWPQIEPGWAPKAKERLPEVKDYCRFEEGTGQGIVKNEAKNLSFREEKIGYAEGNFFDFFSFPLLSGTAKAFNKPDVAFISATYAKKYFATDNPVGKTLTLFNQFGQHSYTIEGIYADMGEDSDIRYDIVFSLETLKNPANLGGNNWASLDNIDSQYINMYFTLNEGADYLAFEKKLTALRRELQREKDALVLRVQPAAHIHLADNLDDPLQHSGNVRYVYVLLMIACLILLIAWFNYINLSTANALKRANEVGVRKAIGATQANLINQFLGESVLVNVLAFALAMLLVVLLQPLFNDLIGRSLSLNVLTHSTLWATGLGLLLVGSLASGAYTAFALSRFSPVETLKGKLIKGNNGALLRKSLVVSQFSISIGLILFTILAFSQLRYMQTKDLGLNTNELLVIRGPEIGKDSTYKNRLSAFWNQVAQQRFVEDYCLSGSVPSRWYNFSTEGFTSPKSKAGDENKTFSFVLIGDRFVNTYGLQLKAGRNFTEQECAVDWNDNDKILVNERAIAQLGFESAEQALTSKIKWDERYLQIIGVLKDYHHSSPQEAIAPIIFYPQHNNAYFTLRLSTDQIQSNVAALEKLFKQYFSGNPFDYFFLDESYNQRYFNERQFVELFTSASVLAIFIACLGLFGLATFTVEARTKEVGIRKVLGASAASIITLLSKDFLKLVIVAIVIASPIAYYFMDKWLQDYAYQVSISWWIFVVAGGGAITIALLTVSYQALRAALMNPVKSLKTD